MDDCDSPVKALDLCNMHYHRQLKGKPIGGAAPLVLYGDPAIRFEHFADRTGIGCWPWTGTITEHGYGVFHVNGQMMSVHRWSYEHFVGPIPDGMEVDHLCHTQDTGCRLADACPHRKCVNPAHLEAVPLRVNRLRSRSVQADNARKTHCPKGHEYSPENTWVSKDGWRQCRACWAIKDAERRADGRKRKAS